MKRVLIVDDEEQFRMMVKDFLQMTGYMGAVAENAPRALEILRRESCDLVISDIRMEGMDGLELARKIRAGYPELGIIIMTGHAAEYPYSEIIEAGADDFIAKPFSMGELKAKIERIERENSTLHSLREANEALSWEVAVNISIAELSEALISSMPIEDISSLVLRRARELTGSPLVYGGYLDRKTGYLVSSTLAEGAYETPHKPDESIAFDEYAELRNWVLENRKPLLLNSVYEAPMLSVRPPGHATIRTFLSVPAMVGERLLGQISLANSEQGYSEKSLTVVNRLATIYALAIQRKWSEGELNEHRFHLEELVEERTQALSSANDLLQREIGERRQVENALRHAKEEWERTFDSVPDLIAVMDTGHRFLKMNKAMADRLGIRPEQGVGLPCHLFMHVDGIPSSNCPLNRMLADGLECTVEIYEERLNGYFLITVAPFYDDQGKLIGGIHIARDITARKEMENALRTARDELETRVRERTAELAISNVQLRREVDERKRAERALRQSERFLQASVDALSAHIAVLDENGYITFINKAWRNFAEANSFSEENHGIGLNYLDVCESAVGEYSNDAMAVAEGIRKVVSRMADEFHLEYPVKLPEETRWFVVRVTRFEGEGPVHVAVAHEEISERKRIEEQLLHDAFHDSLTGLANRALFLDRLNHSAGRAGRRNDYLFAVLFLDLDHFKLINDSLGHMAGDQLLVAMATRIQACIRSSDTLARLGGDEFTILLDDLQDISEAPRFAERIQSVLNQPFRLGDRDIFTTVSVGIALSETGFIRAEDLLRDADTAMYRAKALGRARHEMFDKDMHTQVVKRMQMEIDLRRAIDNRDFVLHYQPVVALETGEIAGFEALIRFLHPERGLIMPMEFIPLAEETGLIVPIGLWVLEEACNRMREWHNKYPYAAHLMIGINLSGRQMKEPDLVDQTERILRKTGISASRVKLEITESVIMENAESTIVLLSRLKTLGIRLSVDDFGTGYSSLSYLHRFPIDVLKIDRSFVSNMSLGNENYEIVRTIVSLAHNLGLKLIAEGPETEDQVSQLRSLNCEYGQGFFFSRPVDAERAESLIAGGGRYFNS